MLEQAKSGAERRSTLLYVLLAAALLIFIQTFTLLAPILLSLLLVLLISLALNPLIARLRTLTGGRKGAAGLLVLVVIGVIGLTGWAFSVPIKDSVTQFSEQLPKYWERLQKPLIKLEQKAVSSEEKLQAEVSTEIAREEVAASEFEAEPGTANVVASEAEPEPPSSTASEPESPSSTASEPEPPSSTAPEPESGLGSVRSSLGEMLEGAFGSFTAVAFNGARMLVVLLTVFFGVIYTVMNPYPIYWAMFSLVPGRHHDQALTIMQRIAEFVPRWAGATLLGMVTIGLLVFLLMWPIFGVMDALVLGLVAGIFEAIPFLGPLLSAVPALLLAFGEGGMAPVWVLLSYIGIQALENNVIVPFVMAHGLKLHPLAVIFSMLLCVAAFGVLGVLVAAPLLAIVSILHDELYRQRFLPTVTDADLDRLSRKALHEELPAKP